MVTSHRCDFLFENNERCGKDFQVVYVLFRDPMTRKTEEVALCPRHFGDEIEEPLIIPIKKLRYKLSNLIARNNRESKIAKSSETPFNYDERRGEVEQLQKKIQHEIAYKCSNVICGKALQSNDPVWAMLLVNRNGKVSFKFYLCSSECYNKMRHRVGLIKVDLIKVQTLTEFA